MKQEVESELLHVGQVMSSSEASSGPGVVWWSSGKRRELLHDSVFVLECLGLVEFVLVDLLNRWSFLIHRAVAVSVHDFDRVAESVYILLLESSGSKGEEDEAFEEAHFWFLLVWWLVLLVGFDEEKVEECALYTKGHKNSCMLFMSWGRLFRHVRAPDVALYQKEKEWARELIQRFSIEDY